MPNKAQRAKLEKMIKRYKPASDKFVEDAKNEFKNLPFADFDLNGPYYKDSHRELRKRARDYVLRYAAHKSLEWDTNEVYPGKQVGLHTKAYEAGVLGMVPVDFTPRIVKDWRRYGGTDCPDNIDYFHFMILQDELIWGGGTMCGVNFVTFLALAPIMRQGSRYVKDLCCEDIIKGRKTAGVCFSEPSAGSDFAALKATATKDGDDYIINGEKYWISGGMYADWFVVAARTGKAGMMGISLILVDATAPGIIRTKMKTTGSMSMGTSYVVFKDVRVPRKNLIGIENMGFMQVMEGFNHERFGMAVHANGLARICMCEAVKWARERKTFGKPLMKHQIIRHKIGEMIRHIIATHGMLEYVADLMNRDLPMKVTAAAVAMLKIQATRTLELCARDASQVFGGRSYIRGGRAGVVEGIHRTVKSYVIPGGSEEIMMELATKISKL